MAGEVAGRLDLEDRRYGAPVEGGSPSPSITLPRGQAEEEGPHFIRTGKQRVVPSCRGCHTRGRGDACRSRDSDQKSPKWVALAAASKVGSFKDISGMGSGWLGAGEGLDDS